MTGTGMRVSARASTQPSLRDSPAMTTDSPYDAMVERAAKWLREHLENTHWHVHENWEELTDARKKIYRVTAREMVNEVLGL